MQRSELTNRKKKEKSMLYLAMLLADLKYLGFIGIKQFIETMGQIYENICRLFSVLYIFMCLCICCAYLVRMYIAR